MNAIEARSLCKRYKEKTAVDSLSLAVKEGELFSLLGVNGAGKTTTIKMLSCLTGPSSGEAFVMGRSVQTEALAVKACINVSPQETAVAPNLTVEENLVFICGIYGHTPRDSKEKAQETIKRFGMTGLAGQKAKTLSGGWQRRLSIAMALITEPKVLFLDEPTLGLDVLARRELWDVIRQLKGSMTIILTTHYLEEAHALSDHIGIMAGGRLAALGTAEALMEKAGTTDFEEAFVRLCGKGAAAL